MGYVSNLPLLRFQQAELIRHQSAAFRNGICFYLSDFVATHEGSWWNNKNSVKEAEISLQPHDEVRVRGLAMDRDIRHANIKKLAFDWALRSAKQTLKNAVHAGTAKISVDAIKDKKGTTIVKKSAFVAQAIYYSGEMDYDSLYKIRFPLGQEKMIMHECVLMCGSKGEGNLLFYDPNFGFYKIYIATSEDLADAVCDAITAIYAARRDEVTDRLFSGNPQFIKAQRKVNAIVSAQSPQSLSFSKVRSL